MKKWIIGMVVLGLLVGGSVMAVAQQKATPEQTQKYIQEKAPSEYVPPVPKPTPVPVEKSTDTVKGSTTTFTSPPAKPTKP